MALTLSYLYTLTIHLNARAVIGAAWIFSSTSRPPGRERAPLNVEGNSRPLLSRKKNLRVYNNIAWAWSTSNYRRGAKGEEKIAAGFERRETVTTVVGGQEVTWVERRLVVRSLAHAQAAEAALGRRSGIS